MSITCGGPGDVSHTPSPLPPPPEPTRPGTTGSRGVCPDEGETTEAEDSGTGPDRPCPRRDGSAQGRFRWLRAAIPVPPGVKSEAVHLPPPICTRRRREVSPRPGWLAVLPRLGSTPSSHQAAAAPASARSGEPLARSLSGRLSPAPSNLGGRRLPALRGLNILGQNTHWGNSGQGKRQLDHGRGPGPERTEREAGAHDPTRPPRGQHGPAVGSRRGADPGLEFLVAAPSLLSPGPLRGQMGHRVTRQRRTDSSLSCFLSKWHEGLPPCAAPSEQGLWSRAAPSAQS